MIFKQIWIIIFTLLWPSSYTLFWSPFSKCAFSFTFAPSFISSCIFSNTWYNKAGFVYKQPEFTNVTCLVQYILIPLFSDLQELCCHAVLLVYLLKGLLVKHLCVHTFTKYIVIALPFEFGIDFGILHLQHDFLYIWCLFQLYAN